MCSFSIYGVCFVFGFLGHFFLLFLSLIFFGAFLVEFSSFVFVFLVMSVRFHSYMFVQICLPFSSLNNPFSPSRTFSLPPSCSLPTLPFHIPSLSAFLRSSLPSPPPHLPVLTHTPNKNTSTEFLQIRYHTHTHGLFLSSPPPPFLTPLLPHSYYPHPPLKERNQRN